LKNIDMYNRNPKKRVLYFTTTLLRLVSSGGYQTAAMQWPLGYCIAALWLTAFGDKCPPTVRRDNAVRVAGRRFSAGEFRQRLDKIIMLGKMQKLAGLGGIKFSSTKKRRSAEWRGGLRGWWYHYGVLGVVCITLRFVVGRTLIGLLENRKAGWA
jgi:hypothetical protein